MNQVFSTKTAAETEKLANQLLIDILGKRTISAKHEGGIEEGRSRIVLLRGQLGSGKTTFVKGLAKALGVTETIKSPTYTYVNKYEVKNIPSLPSDPHPLTRGETSQLRNFKTLYHFDLYRLPDNLPANAGGETPSPCKGSGVVGAEAPQIAASIGLEDALNDPHAIVVIEWPERLPILKPCLLLQFEKKNNHHFISVKEQLH